MARSPVDLPRMQDQARPRVTVAHGPSLVPLDAEAAPKPRKPLLMRQYDLIDRVKQYNPAANEDLLNRDFSEQATGKAMDTLQINVTVNGRAYQRRVEPRLLLSDFIRHEIGLTGTHVGCESGVCGACTVLLDGLATRACCMLAVQADGRRIETVESLGRANNLNPLQRAFWEMHGLQCGYCTPGMLMLMTELLRENPHPDRETIRLRLNDNICRCTGYEDIVNSVVRAVELMRGETAVR